MNSSRPIERKLSSAYSRVLQIGGFQTVRIEELKAYCKKKGLDFEMQEASYQKKLAEKRAKAEAKARKKQKSQFS